MYKMRIGNKVKLIPSDSDALSKSKKKALIEFGKPVDEKIVEEKRGKK